MNDADKAELTLIVAGWLFFVLVACVILLVIHFCGPWTVDSLIQPGPCGCCPQEFQWTP